MSLDGRADLWAQANTRGPRFSKPMLAFLLANFPALESAPKDADFAVVGRDAPAFPIFDEPGNPPRSICARCAGTCSDLWLNLQGSFNLRRELRRIAAFRTILILDVVLRLAHGGQSWLRRGPVSSFFSALLLLGGDAGGRRKRSSS